MTAADRKPGCYYGPDRPTDIPAEERDCGICGYCRGETDGLARAGDPYRPPVARVQRGAVNGHGWMVTRPT